MNFVRQTVKDAAIGVGLAETPEALSMFLKPGCAAAIWRRQTPQSIQGWLDGLEPDCLPSGRVILPVAAVADTIQHLCDMSGLPDGPERAWLQADIVALVNRFSSLMEVKHLRLRLDVVSDNSCRKFHIDAITGRLVCTYRGTGTQYGISTDGHDPRRVFTVQTGAPILLKGTLWDALWPNQPPSGLLHRSPPIEGTGETRLVLVLDPITDPEGVL